MLESIVTMYVSEISIKHIHKYGSENYYLLQREPQRDDEIKLS